MSYKVKDFQQCHVFFLPVCMADIGYQLFPASNCHYYIYLSVDLCTGYHYRTEAEMFSGVRFFLSNSTRTTNEQVENREKARAFMGSMAHAEPCAQSLSADCSHSWVQV